MNIKKNIWALAAALLFATAFTNCSDWTEVEAEKKVEYGNTETPRPESYYQALREWKKTDHSISFGWFSGWGDPAVLTASMLMGLPDSMDMVSLWDNSSNLSQGKIEDLRMVQQKKGTKVLMCTFIQYVGKGFTPAEYDVDEATREAFWGWKEVQKLDEEGNPMFDKQGNPIMVPEENAMKASLEKYAQAIADTIYKYGYDGLDIDFEPNVDGYPNAKLDEHPDRVEVFLDILCKHLGPQSNSGKMLVIDGELWKVPSKTATYFDYFIGQAYSVSGGTPSPTAGQSESNMDSRLRQIINNFGEYMSEEEITKRFIVTENMESAIDALNGGYYWTLRNGTRLDKAECPSLLGMARWQPVNGFRKGGFGGYRFSNEAVNKPSYKWMRTGIQAQNPAVN